MIVTDEMVEKSKGTKTEHFATQVEVDEILSLLTQTMDQTEHDIEKIFSQTLRNIHLHWGTCSLAQDAMTFNNFHEGIHLA
jgi:hypothetical protein